MSNYHMERMERRERDWVEEAEKRERERKGVDGDGDEGIGQSTQNGRLEDGQYGHTAIIGRKRSMEREYPGQKRSNHIRGSATQVSSAEVRSRLPAVEGHDRNRQS